MRRAALVAGGFAAGVAAMALAVLSLVMDARAAQRHLQAAEADAHALVAVAARGEMPPTLLLERLQRDAEAAHGATHGWLWRLVGKVPALGATPRTVDAIAAAVVADARDVLPPLMALARDTRQRPLVTNGRVDLSRLSTAAATLRRAAAAADRNAARVDRAPGWPLLPQVRRDLRRARSALHRVDTELRAAADLATAAGPMLGGDGERRYLVALQNNAEARGTGGLAGAYVVMAADHGALRVVRTGTDDDLRTVRAPVGELGAGYGQLYGVDAALWTNANLSPYFPAAARLWLAGWQQKFGTPLDGVVATDPVALKGVLAATGAVRAGGLLVTANDVVSLTERDLYTRYEHDNAGRKRALVAILRRVLDRTLHPADGRASGLLAAAARAAAKQRLLAYSVHPAEERALASAGWAGLLGPPDAPYLRLTVDNAGGNKLDYYLRRRLDYRLGPCVAGRRESTVTAELTNGVPSVPLPRYVASRADLGPGRGVPGSNRLLVYLHLTSGAGLRSAVLDGQRVAVHVGAEQGHPVVALALDLDRGQTRTLVLRLLEPALRTPPVVQVQPLVLPQRTTVTDSACRTA